MNNNLANLTWFTDQALYVGATYVTENLSIDVPPAGSKVTIYTPDGRKDISEPAATVPTTPPTLSNWQWRDAAAEAAPGYVDSIWASSSQPQPWGIYSFQNGYGWYRAKFTVASAGNMTFNIANVKESAMAFVNGQQVQLNNNSGSFNAVAGEKTMAILATQRGLNTYSTGNASPDGYAGIWGGVTKSGGGALATSWRFRGGLGGMEETALIGRVTNWADFLSGAWTAGATGKGPSFWMTTFKSPLQSGAFVTVGLKTNGMSTGSVWINGHNIGRFTGSTLLYVPECWLTADNSIVVYDATGNSPAGVQLQYIETRARYATSTGIIDGGAGNAGRSGSGGVNSLKLSGSVISYNLSNASFPVSLSLFDVRGRLIKILVKNEKQSAGTHSVELKNSLRPGTYIASLRTVGHFETKTVVVGGAMGGY